MKAAPFMSLVPRGMELEIGELEESQLLSTGNAGVGDTGTPLCAPTSQPEPAGCALQGKKKKKGKAPSLFLVSLLPHLLGGVCARELRRLCPRAGGEKSQKSP